MGDFLFLSVQVKEEWGRDYGNSRPPLRADGGGKKSWVQEYSCPYFDNCSRINRDLSETENKTANQRIMNVK